MGSKSTDKFNSSHFHILFSQMGKKIIKVKIWINIYVYISLFIVCLAWGGRRLNQKQRLDCSDSISHNPQNTSNITWKKSSRSLIWPARLSNPRGAFCLINTRRKNAAYSSSHLHTLAAKRSSERSELALWIFLEQVFWHQYASFAPAVWLYRLFSAGTSTHSCDRVFVWNKPILS